MTRLRPWRAAVGLALTSAVLTPVTLRAQSGWQFAVRDAVKAMPGVRAAEQAGFVERGMQFVRAPHGELTDRDLHLAAGEEYRVFGTCDAQCPDMDLSLYDPSGVLLTSHDGRDKTPTLSVTTNRAGTYRLVVKLYCNAPLCGSVVATYGRSAPGAATAATRTEPAASGPSRPEPGRPGVGNQPPLPGSREAAEAADWVQRIGVRLENSRRTREASRAEFRPATTPVAIRIPQGETRVFPIPLWGGTDWHVIGVCDSQCTNLDLSLVGPDGATVAEDTGPGDDPVLRVTARVSGDYRLRVTMATCRDPACGVGIWVFRKSPTSSAPR